MAITEPDFDNTRRHQVHDLPFRPSPTIPTFAATEPDFNYLTIKGDVRLEMLAARLEEREKFLWEIELILVMLQSNPHLNDVDKAELERLSKLKPSVVYSINQLRALRGTLS